MENKIRQLRDKKGWSQQQLASAVGTSQQQIARIETGNQSVKVDLALAIAATLGTDLGKLFPATRKLLGRGRNRKDRDELVALHYDPKALSEFESAGVDLDPASWLLKFRLRGGARVEFVCSAADTRRIRRNLEKRDTGTPFVVFHSAAVAVALNLEHLTHYHELWEGGTAEDWQDDEIPREAVAVFFSDEPKPEVFEVEVDGGVPGDELDEGQMRGLLFTLETFLDPGEFVSFTDVDGEDAFFRAADIALLTIPLRILDARLDDSLLEAESPSFSLEGDQTTADTHVAGDEPSSSQ